SGVNSSSEFGRETSPTLPEYTDAHAITQTNALPAVTAGASGSVNNAAPALVGSAQSGGASGVASSSSLGSGSLVPASTTASTPYGEPPWPVPGIIQAENFDNGGQGVAYYDTTPGNTGGAFRNTDVDISTTTDPGGGGYNVGWIAATEWLNY